MKKAFVLICTLVTANLLSAQSGKITYQEKITFDITLDSIQMAQLGDIFLPSEKTSETTLLFTSEATLYEPVIAEPETPADMEGGIRMMVMTDQFKVYTQLPDGNITEQREFMGRSFLIEAPRDNVNWKTTGRFKTIAGHNCMEAAAIYKTDTVSAWFAPDIPVSSGPEGWQGLPGLILELNFNNGKRIITAVNVESETIIPKLIQKPAKGKKVTREKFRSIVDEKMKEMGAEGGGNTVIQIRISQ